MGVDIIALAGLDAETGIVMPLYLDLAYEDGRRQGRIRQPPPVRSPFLPHEKEIVENPFGGRNAVLVVSAPP